MALYAILNQWGKPIAYHHKKRIIKQHLNDLKNPKNIIVKVKHPKELEHSTDYAELYLVKIGGGFVPANRYDSASILTEEELYNYDSVINLLSRELEFNEDHMRTKEYDSIVETIGYLTKRIKEIKHEIPDLKNIDKFDEMRSRYKDRFYDV